MTPRGAERRQHERRVLRVQADIVLSPLQLTRARTTDISVGGMGIIADPNLPVGTSLIVKLILPLPSNFIPIEAHAEVMHSILACDMRGYKVGLRFMSPCDMTVSSIHKFVSNRFKVL